MNKLKGARKNTDADTEAEGSRRKFLKNAGKLAAYTPPAMMLLMNPSISSAGGSIGVHQHPSKKKYGQKKTSMRKKASKRKVSKRKTSKKKNKHRYW